jgi:hypothetical protein
LVAAEGATVLQMPPLLLRDRSRLDLIKLGVLAESAQEIAAQVVECFNHNKREKEPAEWCVDRFSTGIVNLRDELQNEGVEFSELDLLSRELERGESLASLRKSPGVLRAIAGQLVAMTQGR